MIDFGVTEESFSSGQIAEEFSNGIITEVFRFENGLVGILTDDGFVITTDDGQAIIP